MPQQTTHKSHTEPGVNTDDILAKPGVNTEQEKGTTVEHDIQQKAVSVPLSPPHCIMTRSRTGTVIRPPDRL